MHVSPSAHDTHVSSSSTARVNQLISGRTDLAELPKGEGGGVGGVGGGRGKQATSVGVGCDGVPGVEKGGGEGGRGGRKGGGVKKLSRTWMKRALDFGFSCIDREVYIIFFFLDLNICV
jgi:hypothetical protein